MKPVMACRCCIGAPFQEGISTGLIKLVRPGLTLFLTANPSFAPEFYVPFYICDLQALRHSVNVPLKWGNLIVVIHYFQLQAVIPGFQDWLILYQLFTNASGGMTSSHEIVSYADTPPMKGGKKHILLYKMCNITVLYNSLFDSLVFTAVLILFIFWRFVALFWVIGMLWKSSNRQCSQKSLFSITCGFKLHKPGAPPPFFPTLFPCTLSSPFWKRRLVC